MEQTKRCLDCGKEKPLKAFRLCFSGKTIQSRPDYAERNPWGLRQNRCIACYSARERAKMKLDFLYALGCKCACCGESDHRFLTLDHVGNDGNRHRREYACHQIYRQARKEGYPPGRYQVLCFNCNMGKSVNGGVCPHKDGISSEEAFRRLEARETYIGRDHVGPNSGSFTSAPDSRRSGLHRRVLKPCPYCGVMFGTNEMTRHKRAEHKPEMIARRNAILAAGRVK